MSCEGNKEGAENQAAKKAAEAATSELDPEPERGNSSGEPVHWLIPMKKKIGQKFNTYLAVTVFLMLLSLTITVLWVVPVVISQNKRIASIEERLTSEMARNQETLREEFEQLEKIDTARITELESNFTAMRQDAEAKITELEKNISASETELAELADRLREKEKLLEDALARAELFEQEHNTTMDRVSTLEAVYPELNRSTLALQGKVQDLEEGLANTTAEAATIGMRVNSLESGVASLNTTKANRVTLDELTVKVDLLDAGKANRMELEIVSSNVTTLVEVIHHTQGVVSDIEIELEDTRGELNAAEERLEKTVAETVELGIVLNITANRTSSLEASHEELSSDLRLTREELHNKTSALEDATEDLEERLTNTTGRTLTLEMKLNDVESDIDSLNDTKASKDTVNDKLGILDSEFEMLMANLSSLAEASSRMDQDIVQELNELADSALNETHYHELHQAIASKASQTDLEALASSTVRTQTFLQRVESIQNSILQLQWNITLNFTHFDGRIQTLNAALSTKADQQDVATLSNRVTTLEGSTVDKNTFQVLRDSVEDINERKADKTDLNLLQGRVNSLERNTATKSELRSLDDKLSGHSSTSDGVHNRLSSSIGSNSYSISGNTGRITQLESSTSGLTPSQVVIAVSLSLTLVRWASY
jgi:DNA repair exonuclease SbcCD ATPase subunit